MDDLALACKSLGLREELNLTFLVWRVQPLLEILRSLRVSNCEVEGVMVDDFFWL